MADNSQLSIYVPQDKRTQEPVERLMRLAEETDRSVNYLVVQAILEYLDAEEAKDRPQVEVDSASQNLGEGQDAPDLSVPAAQEASSEPGGLLQRYVEWAPRRTPDPRACATSEVANCLSEIVRAESPIVKERAFRLCANAAGIGKIGGTLKSRYAEALEVAKRAGTVKAESCHIHYGEKQVVLWSPGAERAVARDRGPRTELYHIPLPELAEAMRGVGITAGMVERQEAYFHRILHLYGFKRLTARAHVYLQAAKVIAGIARQPATHFPRVVETSS